MPSSLRLEIRAGAIAVWRERLVLIEQRVGLDEVAVHDLATDEQSTVRIGELRSRPHLSARELARREEVPRATDRPPWNAAMDRERIIRDLLGDPKPPPQRVLAAAAQLNVSRRTVYRWIKQYRNAPQTTSLVTGRRGRPRGLKLLDSAREQVIDRAIQENYLKRPRAKPETIYKEVNVRCAAEGLKSVSRSAVLARIRRLDPRLVACKRHGAKHARSNAKPVPGQFRVEGAGHVLQIDHTHADVHVVDDQYRQPRPSATLSSFEDAILP